MRGLVRVCTCVGAEAFAPYMAAILAPVLHSAALEDACVLRDEGENKSPLEGKKGYEVIKMDLRAVGEQYVCINTAMLEEKALAVELLFEYATALGVVFLPYLQPCVELVTPMLRYPYHEEVRQASCRALPAFMGVAQKVARQLQSISPDQLAQMFEFMAGPFLEAIEKENLLDALEEELEMFALLLKEFALPLSAQAVERVNAVVASITGACLQRRQFRKEQEKENEDMDEEGLAELEAENGKEDDMLTSLYAVVGQVCKNCRESYFVPFTKTLLPVFKPLLGHSGAAVPDGLVLPAMFIIDDVLEYCSTLAQASLYVPWFFPIVKKLCKSENVDLRHSAAFGVGSCAKALGPMFREAKAALETLTAIIRAPGSREGEESPPRTTPSRRWARSAGTRSRRTPRCRRVCSTSG